jgi:hypothetical protein
LTGGISSEVLTFQLTATNNDGTEAQDTVNITVVNVNTQPVANAGDDLTVKEGTYVELTGLSSYDVDGDDLSYAWTQVSGPDVNLSSTGSAVTNFTAPLLDGGAGGEALILEFQLDVFDGFDHAYDTVVVTVEQVNHDPSASAGLDQTVNSGDHVLLDGQGSSDPDNDPLFYYWTQTDGPTVNLDNSQSMAPSFDAPFVTETTTFTFELVVSDGLATSQPDEIIVTVLSPNDPPQCQLAVAEPAFLWPPNHKMEVINIVGITDRDNDNIQITILGVTQDEPVDGLGAGDTAPDAAIQTESVLVRAERSGLGDGRVYKVNFKATDEYGDSCSGSVDVKVLHDRKNGETATDSGQYFNSMMP